MSNVRVMLGSSLAWLNGVIHSSLALPNISCALTSSGLWPWGSRRNCRMKIICFSRKYEYYKQK
ncbi:hypothetical protein ZEAMMB73_Zm00001d018430 [Zea mays]|uniref:Uncharacterized protein n=1 Tax=Zea mays TaxID=4577 RepID=A0A1D6HNW5_MAIZE|nr:hypothetical protein ZEAMMB73_Zm00001d018430 [Zea mays]